MQEKIEKIVGKFMNKKVLNAGKNKYRLCELEAYIFNENHDDIFTHKSNEQTIKDIWYFHKKGGTYKSGTYKGLDICRPINGGYGGILIRSIMNLENGDFIEGPCCVVNEILRSCSKRNISELVENIRNDKEYCSIYDNDSLFISSNKEDFKKRTIYTSPRVGLTLKGKDIEKKSSYIMRDYRYSTYPKKIKKNRFGWILSLHMKGTSVSDIEKITGSKKGYIEKCINQNDDSFDIDDWSGKSLKVSDICKLYILLNNSGF